jgi:hypothetical protein
MRMMDKAVMALQAVFQNVSFMQKKESYQRVRALAKLTNKEKVQIRSAKDMV